MPFLSSAMDTVIESSMAISLAREGGIGIVIHRNLNIKDQAKEIKKLRKKIVSRRRSWDKYRGC